MSYSDELTTIIRVEVTSVEKPGTDIGSDIAAELNRDLKNLQKTAMVSLNNFFDKALNNYMGLFKTRRNVKSRLQSSPSMSTWFIDGTSPEGFYYPLVLEKGRGPVFPKERKALWWEGLPHPVPSAGPFKGYQFMTKTRNDFENMIDQAVGLSLDKVIG
jgi:hypothetical protein